MAGSATPLPVEFAEALFASPLFSFRVPEAHALNVRLLAEVAALRQVDAGVGRSNLGGWHSSFDLFEREEPGCAELCGVLVAAVHQATLRVAPTFAFARWGLQCEGWFSVLPPGACNAPHTHPTYAWSGVYYVAVPPPPVVGDAAALELFDPRPPIGYAPIQGAGCFQDSRRVQPEAGQLLLFPAYLRHWVYPNTGPTERVSVAFNARWVPQRRPGA